MPDSVLNPGPADRTRVNVNQPHEVRYWCGAFNCTKRELLEAVIAVGPIAKDVRGALHGPS